MNTRTPSPYSSRGRFSMRRLSTAVTQKIASFTTIALLGVASVIPGRAAEWLNESFTDYAAAGTYTTDLANGVAITSTTSPLLVSTGTGTKVFDEAGNKYARFQKLTAAAASPNFLYALSPAFATPRPQGYISFKVTVNARPSAAVSGALIFRLGANDSNNLASASSAFVDLRFNQPVTTFGVKAFSANVQSGGNTTMTPAGTNTARIWYNSTASPMAYTDPAGTSQTLGAGKYVAWVNSILVSASASGSDMAASVITTGATSSSVIGKVGFSVPSSSTADFSIDELYAADSAPSVTVAPIITSLTAAQGFTGIPFNYQIVADTATSFGLTGTLPDGLTFNAATGVISGTPTTLGGPATVALTATNTAGTSAPVNLDITILPPVNIFTGSNPSLNTTASWSLGQAPNSTSNTIGSYQDVTLASSVTDLTTTSATLFVKSWNVTNGGSYTLSALSSNSTVFRMGDTGSTDTTPFTDIVSGGQNDMVYLTGNSNLTFSASNPTSGVPSIVELRNSGNLNIGANSTLTLNASIFSSSATSAITKTGAGMAVFGAAGTYAGATTLSAGTLTLAGSATPTVTARAIATLSGGVITGYTIVDGGAGYTVAPAITIVKAVGNTTGSGATATATISGGAVTAINVVAGGTGYTLSPQVNILNNQSPLGTGPFTLSGGTLNGTVDADLGRTFQFVDPTGSFFRIGGTATTINGPVTVNVADTKTVTAFTLTGNSDTGSLLTKTGPGTLWLRGSSAATVMGGWSVNGGTLFIGTSSSTSLGSGKVSLNGGDLRFSRGASSTGAYTSQGMDIAIEVLQDATLTLDANPLSAPGANTVSFTGLTVGTSTINLVKSATVSTSEDAGYNDPLITFFSGTLTGNTTLNVGPLTQLTLQAASGTGGLIKTGPGRLTLANNSTAFTSNTYTGATTITQGTLALSGNHSSALSLAGGTVLELNLANTVASSNTVSFSANSTVSIVGTPVAATTYTLVNASVISGTPALSAPIAGFALVNTGTSLQLAPAGSGDTTPPVITLIGSASVSLAWGASYTDAGATATDNVDPSVTVVTSGIVNPATPGVYTLTYNATDSATNAATPVTRTVTVSIANATTPGADGYSPLMRYAFGANSPTDTIQVPLTTATATTLAITAVVRTDDAGLTVSAETNTDLTAAGAWASTGVVVTTASDQSNKPDGCVRKVFTVDTTGAAKKFLRFKAVATF